MPGQHCASEEQYPRVAVSFIVDEDPVFAYTGWHLAHSIIANSRVTPNDLHVQFTPEVSADIRALFAGTIGCQVHEIQRFGDGKYCNKLNQWAAIADAEHDVVVLLDTDMICLDDFVPFLPHRMIGAKVVDLPNPPVEVLEKLFRNAGFDVLPDLTSVDANPRETFVANCNGGFYTIPSGIAAQFFAQWQLFATKLLADIEPLRAIGKESHVDQIAFAMAVHAGEYPFEELPSNVNYFTHFEGEHRNFDPARPISLLHYHNSSLNVVGLLDCKGASKPHEVSAQSNANRQIRKNFQSGLFWQMRYSRFPERGSGVGSRGKNAAYKRDLLIAEGIESAASVLDIGCGDLEVLAPLQINEYVGLDQSPESLATARAKRPDWEFRTIPSSDCEEADFVLCLEVAIHQPTQKAYRELVHSAAQSAKKTLIISGYEHEGEHVTENHMIFFYEPLSTTLEQTGLFRSIKKVGAHSDVAVYRCDR